VSKMCWPMMAAFVANANFGTVESKSSREGCGRRSCRRSAAPPSTGNTDYFRAPPLRLDLPARAEELLPKTGVFAPCLRA
jgi:hypothetical protein